MSAAIAANQHTPSGGLVTASNPYRLHNSDCATLSRPLTVTATGRGRGYPSRPGARWLWAVVVDMMAAAMVVWGCSGLLMWWQMKSLRRWGAVALAASVVAATCLALAMHAVLAR